MDFKLKLRPMQWAPYPIDKLRFFQATASGPGTFSFKTRELHCCCASLEGTETEFRDKLSQLGDSCVKLQAYRYRHSATKTATGPRKILGLDPIRDGFPGKF